MGERGRVECPVCGAMGEPFPCGHHLHFARELASALKRCENALEIALESDAIHQAKCERLEAALRRITQSIPDTDWTHNRLIDELDHVAEIAESALSTPKTEGTAHFPDDFVPGLDPGSPKTEGER